ncbi:hypothetical protein E2320_022346, partial [Naja naja]
SQAASPGTHTSLPPQRVFLPAENKDLAFSSCFCFHLYAEAAASQGKIRTQQSFLKNYFNNWRPEGTPSQPSHGRGRRSNPSGRTFFVGRISTDPAGQAGSKGSLEFSRQLLKAILS